MHGPSSQWLREVPILETRKTFVLWVSQEPEAGHQPSADLEGRLEEVDTGRELRFRSAEQLVGFLKECLKAEEKRKPESGEQI